MRTVVIIFCLGFFSLSVIYAQDGQLDLTFGNSGVVYFAKPDSAQLAIATAIQDDSKILVAIQDTAGHFLLRLMPDGSLDVDFGVNGEAVIPGSGVDILSMRIQSDGRIVVLKYSSLVRMREDGSIDSTYGVDGVATLPLTFYKDGTRNHMAIQSDNKIVVGGAADGVFADRDFAVLRYDVNGILDNTFGQNGMMKVDFAFADDNGTAIAIQSDGKILLAGLSIVGSALRNLSVCRLTVGGNLDESFASGGKSVRAGIDNFSNVNDIDILSDGGMIITGCVTSSPGYLFQVKLDSTGFSEDTFGDHGISYVGAIPATVYSVVALSDNSTIIGFPSPGPMPRFAVLKLLANGQPDYSFGINGFANLGVDTNGDVECTEIVVQSDGKIIAVGFVSELSPPSIYHDRRSVITRIGGSVSPVPVEMVSFLAVNQRTRVLLRWTTATEIANHGFEVERRPGGIQNATWNSLGFVPGSGTSSSTRQYEFVDDKPTIGRNRYRLKQVDASGTQTYSQEIEVEVLSPSAFHVSNNYPNPFNSTTNIEFEIPTKEHVSLIIFDVLGRVVYRENVGSLDSGYYGLSWTSDNLASGVYYYQIKAGEFIQTKRMVLLK